MSVVLAFERGDPTLPIILGVVRNTLFPPLADAVSTAESQHVRARVLTWEAEEYLELRCGGASISLSTDGKAEVKGREVVSRASRTNRVRGASVQIN